MRRIAVMIVAAVLLPLLAWATGATSGGYESPGGTVTLNIQITEHPTLPTVVNVSVDEVSPDGPTQTGTGTGGTDPNTCSSFGPITLESGHKYRIHDGKHQWHNKDWSDPDAWQDMKKTKTLPTGG